MPVVLTNSRMTYQNTFFISYIIPSSAVQSHSFQSDDILITALNILFMYSCLFTMGFVLSIFR